MSGYPSINADVLLGFTPGPYGMSVNTYVMFDEAGEYTWTVPTGVTEITAVLIQGGTGGTGGQAGFNGGDGQFVYGLTSNNPVARGGTGGAGGHGGASGGAGKIHTTAIAVSPGQVVSVTVGTGGAGGQGGASNGGEGAAGDDGEESEVTIGGTTYSSINGSVLPNGYSNPLTGEVFGVRGMFDGEAGFDGGGANEVNASSPDYGGESGEDTSIVVNGTIADTRATFRLNGYGGGGGGDVFYTALTTATDGDDGHTSADFTASPIFEVFGGDGGDGASARPGWNLSENVHAGNGGDGGDGGGGGGGGGGAKITWSTSNFINYVGWRECEGGDGGRGGKGADGCDGGVIIYYRAS